MDPSVSYVHCLLGHELLLIEEYENAKNSYQQAININKTEFYGYWGLGNVYLKKDENEKAQEYFQLALQLNPSCSTILTYIGITYNNTDKYDVALKFFEQAESLDSKNLINSYHKATSLFHLN